VSLARHPCELLMSERHMGEEEEAAAAKEKKQDG
jgi:hypothetical protein